MFAKRLKALRKERGLTQIQFARQFNVSSGAIAMWETGKREPDLDVIDRLAKFFRVSSDYLLGKSSFRNPKELIDSWGDFGPYFDSNFDFGDLIKQEREERGITVEELGDGIGLTPEDVENCEDGILPINRELADKMAAFLGTDVSQMLFDNDLYSDTVPEEFHDRIAEWEKLRNAADQEAMEEEMTVFSTPTERRLKLLARHLEKIPENTRNRLIKNFEDTIDTYLDTIGVPKEDKV